MTNLSTTKTNTNDTFNADRGSTIVNDTGAKITNIYQYSGSPVPKTPPKPSRCPRPSVAFVIRESIQDMMDACFFGPNDPPVTRIFVLCGFGGVGKSQLAFHFANKYFYIPKEDQRRFSQVYYVDATTSDTIDQSLKNVARFLGLEQDSARALEELSAKNENWLIIFNNADDPKLKLADYLPRCSHGNILITSRHPGARVNGTHSCDVSNLAPQEALKLLRNIIERGQPSERIFDIESAKDLVKNLGYIALSIAIAGAYIQAKNMSIQEYIDEYQTERGRPFTQHEYENQTLFGNYPYRSVHETWEISYRQLQKQSQIFLQLCSFLHHEGISRELIERMCTRILKLKPIVPFTTDEKDGYRSAKGFAAKLCSQDGKWDNGAFRELINDLSSFSLVNYDATLKICSIHPMVHDWANFITKSQSKAFAAVALLLASTTSTVKDKTEYSFRGSLIPHINKLFQRSQNVPDCFRAVSAFVYLDLGKLDASQKQYNKLAQSRASNEGLGEDHAYTLDAYLGLALTYEKLKDWKKALEIHQKIVQSREKLGDSTHLLISKQNIVSLYSKQNKWHDAASELEKIVEEWKAKFPDYQSNPNALHAMSELSSIYTHQETPDWTKVDNLDMEVVNAYEKMFGKDYHRRLQCLKNSALGMSQRGKDADAIKQIEDVLQRLALQTTKNSPLYIECLSALASVLTKAEMHQRAVEVWQEVVKESNIIYGEGHPDSINNVIKLALSEAQCKNWTISKVRFQSTIEILHKNHPHNIEQILEVELYLGEVQLNLRETQEGKARIERVLKSDFLGPSNWLVTRANKVLKGKV